MPPSFAMPLREVISLSTPLPALCLDRSGKHSIIARRQQDAILSFEAHATQAGGSRRCR
ncbi:hypothetical protein [Burkholderia lata]|uniref:hypothetical protein n=1 Tax=Burkholderia lata (strain ATCC 17760 / DSM 23089 / LMG 22485 / NCIMB 9086 / R18194 / 383) TaxID=482957 RepID=UPI0015815132|nr:hypothetical protein [Burkholderia lata]